MTAIDEDQTLSYSHRVCRRCGAVLHREHRWFGEVWRCSNHAGHRHGARS